MGSLIPNSTQIPDLIIDEWMHDLTGAETKVILYIVRRTFGFKKDGDSISLAQICKGIIKRDGSRLDRGTGLSKGTACAALKSLENRGLITRTQQSTEERGAIATYYAINLDAVVQKEDTPCIENRTGACTENKTGPCIENRTHNRQCNNTQLATAAASSPKKVRVIENGVMNEYRPDTEENDAFVPPHSRRIPASKPSSGSAPRRNKHEQAEAILAEYPHWRELAMEKGKASRNPNDPWPLILTILLDWVENPHKAPQPPVVVPKTPRADDMTTCFDADGYRKFAPRVMAATGSQAVAQ